MICVIRARQRSASCILKLKSRKRINVTNLGMHIGAAFSPPTCRVNWIITSQRQGLCDGVHSLLIAFQHLLFTGWHHPSFSVMFGLAKWLSVIAPHNCKRPSRKQVRTMSFKKKRKKVRHVLGRREEAQSSTGMRTKALLEEKIDINLATSCSPLRVCFRLVFVDVSLAHLHIPPYFCMFLILFMCWIKVSREVASKPAWETFPRGWPTF